MARLAGKLIEQIKTDISLLRLAESQGYQPRKQGKDYALNCPFHQGDKTPSLIISLKSNLYHCFGCGAAGSVIDWVMQTRGVSFRFACELLQKDLGLIADSGTQTVKQNTTTKLATPLSADADSQTALRQVIDYYHETLKQSPEVLAYLENRGLQSAELVDRFKLGFANRTLGYRLPDKVYKAGKAVRGKLQAIGLLRSSGHEHFTGSLVVPVIDEQGIITEVYGRKILGNKLRKGTPQHLYLPGPHEGVWNVEALKASDEIILCEALIDAMTFWVHGYRHVTASYGTQGFTAAHLAAFKAHGIKRVLIAYDRDEAGNQAADQLAKQLTGEGIDCYRIDFPKGMDANDYALQVTPAGKSLGLVIRKATWMGQGRGPGIKTQAVEPGDSVDALEINEPSIDIDIAGQGEAAADDLALPAEPTTASPLPGQAAVIDAEVSDHEIRCSFADRHYRIRGLQKNLSYDQLKINLLVRLGELCHVDTLDLYSARQRAGFVKQASQELGLADEVIKKDLGRVLLKLEALQDEQIKAALTPVEQKVTLTDSEEAAALALLKDPDLVNRILTDFDAAGVVGEETNKLVGYLACVSRKLDQPLAIMVQSSSAAGKSALMEAILAMMPAEEQVQYSAMTGQSLFYMSEINLKHRILAISEEEGAAQASYALKLLQSEGRITIASTGKDAATGNLVTQEYCVEGPVMLFLTTTAIDIDEELLNRCLLLSVNESRVQTRAIHARQRSRQTLTGLLAETDKSGLLQLHGNAQRLLKPLAVVNPFAEQLTFLDDKTRTRRDHMKYLTLIRAIALLHQYQRDIHTVNHQGQALRYIEVTRADIAMANRLAHDVLGRTLDELAPQTRKLLEVIHAWVKDKVKALAMAQADFRFSRRDVRTVSGWGNTQLKVHLKRLEEMEYLLVHRGGRGQSFIYELLYEGQGSEGDAFLMGLIDPETFNSDASRSGDDGHQSGLSRHEAGARPVASQSAQTGINTGVEDNVRGAAINGASRVTTPASSYPKTLARDH